jgi:NADPH:quinone reductase-like Zn-dependent oxidoreductase
MRQNGIWFPLGGENGMKVVEIRDKFGFDSLKVVERPDPVAGSGQIVLKMKAFSINYRDLLVANGVGRWKPSA